MKVWTVAVGIAVAACVVMGCDATTRYRVLTFFFDGVPPPKVPEAPEAKPAGAPAAGAEPRKVGFRAHGPYAARMCNACHNAAEFNALLLPRGELCFKCHEFRLDKKYIHGPLASGGCTACHDPHSSQYRYMLVSESDSFCLRCHERTIVARIPGHADIGEKCTTCHNPHLSDKKYLLR